MRLSENLLTGFSKITAWVPDFCGKPADIKDNSCITLEIRRIDMASHIYAPIGGWNFDFRLLPPVAKRRKNK
jgi:hypothetical protein